MSIPFSGNYDAFALSHGLSSVNFKNLVELFADKIFLLLNCVSASLVTTFKSLEVYKLLLKQLDNYFALNIRNIVSLKKILNKE